MNVALSPPSHELIAALTEIVGARNALTAPADQAPFLREWRDKYVGRSPLVLRPGSVGEVSRILALCNEARVGVVPQTGNTGLVGGQIPFETGTEIVLSLARLDKLRGIDPAGTSMTVEAGMTLHAAREVASLHGRLFPLSLPSEGSCCIGGNLATNAGGIAVLSYGNARNQVLGLEAVLADGRVWNGLKSLKKDNTGYDLKNLLCGSEGTLGIITAATLRLVARPAETAVALAALDGLDAALELFRLADREAGVRLTAFEFMPEIGMAMVTRHMPGTRRALAAGSPWYVLIEISALRADGSAARDMEALLAAAMEAGHVRDAVLARSLAQADDIWRLRETMSEAQKPEGGSIKHDVSVPIWRLGEFIARADALVERLCPGARPVAFGHFGDGNVHYNVSQPLHMPKADFLARWEEMSGAVHALVVEMDGSISAEHGIGRLKRDELAHVKGAVEMDMMRAIKRALDPNGILNPGKVV